MKTRKATAKYDGMLQQKFRDLTPERQDQARYYLHIRLEELLLEQQEEGKHRRRRKENLLYE